MALPSHTSGSATASRPAGAATASPRTYTAPTVLVIDDVGLPPRQDRHAASTFFQVISRDEKGRRPHEHHTLITSAMPPRIDRVDSTMATLEPTA
jgi:hypothetical protein